MHHVGSPKPFHSAGKCLGKLSESHIAGSNLASFASRSSHTDPVSTPHGEAVLHASLAPPRVPCLRVLMLFDLWFPHSPHASSAGLISFSTGAFRKSSKCRLRWEWIHTPCVWSLSVLCPEEQHWARFVWGLVLCHCTKAYVCSHSLSLPCMSDVSL